MIRRFSQLFYGRSNLKQAIGILFVTVLISNVLGLLRNVVIANRVGLTYGSIAPLNHYYAAFVLPDLLYNILIVGALSSAVLPLLVKLDSDGDEAGFWKTINILISTGITVVAIGLVCLYLLLPLIIPYLLPGFSAGDQAETLRLAQVLLLSPLFFTISQLSTSALQAKRFFFAPALAPIIYNLAIIAGAQMIPRFGLPILVVGVIVGAAGHFLVQLPTLIRLGWRFSFQLGFKHSHIRNVIKLMIPRTIALTSTQLLLIVFYQIASNFHNASIAIYRLTDDLQTAPVLLFANTIAVAILPDFARHIAKDNHREFEELVGKSIRLLLFLFMPLTAFLLVFREPIINLYIALGHAISQTETSLAVRTFGFFVISLFFQGAVLLLARAYFARSDTKRPTIYSLISLVIAWGLAEFLAKTTHLDAAGLALAFSVGSFINACLLWFGVKLSWRVLFFDDHNRPNLLLLTVGSLLTAMTFTITLGVFNQLMLIHPIKAALANSVIIGGGLLVGLITYLAWASLWNIEQWNLIKRTKSSTTK